MSATRRYAGFGLCLDSEIELPDLPVSDESAADVCIRLGTVPRSRRAPAGTDEEIRIYRSVGAFHIIRGREIVVDPVPGADSTQLRIIMMGSVMAYLMRQRGWLPLHASGIAIEGRGILFLGVSGAGKSTTAAAFHAVGGYPLITDDVGAVRVVDGVCVVQPSWPRVRLCVDSRPVLGSTTVEERIELDKHSCTLAAGLTDAVPVDCIFALEFGPRIKIGSLPLLNAVTVVSMNTFAVRRRMTRAALSVHARDCVAVADSTTVRRLARPRSLDDLPDLVRVVEHDLQPVS